MARDLVLKLRLTHMVTGCTTQKALHARFKQVNPQTGYEPQRAYKWAQGRAAPRDPSVYEDLARVLDLPVTGEIVRNCSYEEFRRMLEGRHGPAPGLAARPAVGGVGLGGRQGAPGPPRDLLGRYLAFSAAWSATRSGRLMVGVVSIEDGPDGGPWVEYRERLPGGDLVLDGALWSSGRSLTSLVGDRTDDPRIALCFRLPSAPSLALAGLMTGFACHDADARPVAGRIFCVRTGIERREDLLALSGYRDPDGEAAALRGAGVSSGSVDHLATRIVDMIMAPAECGLVDVPAEAVNAVVGPLYEAAG